MAEIKRPLPLLHKHHLLYDKYRKEEAAACCDKCNQQIDGWAFTCDYCNFWLHKSCTQQQLPLEISHPLHSQHPLLLHCPVDYDKFYRHFICHKCSSLSSGFRYRCEDCDFYLDVNCAFSNTNDQTPHQIRSHKIDHLSHMHSLVLFKYRKVRKYEYCCRWCDETPLPEVMSYACFHYHYPPERYTKVFVTFSGDECYENTLILHESCLRNIPTRILKHPFHPSHPLSMSIRTTSFSCSACHSDAYRAQGYYSCQRCDFYLHLFCAKLKPTLGVECHPHYLTYIIGQGGGSRNNFGYSRCHFCHCSMEHYDSYSCVQCNFNVHFNCLIPNIIKNKYHKHPLIVMTSVIEDFFCEYYCDICEKPRNPNHHVYCCIKCKYVSHIECGLNKFVDSEFFHGPTYSSNEEETLQNEKDFPAHHRDQIEYFDHPHALSFTDQRNLVCKGCKLEIIGGAYACEECKYYLHKTCSELPDQLLLHPLHPNHPLILLTGPRFVDPVTMKDFTTEQFLLEAFMCDKCRDLSDGFSYACCQCNFKLDLKCSVANNFAEAASKIDEFERRPTNLLHFSHCHELLLANFNPTYYEQKFICLACYLPISGPAYWCLQCNVCLHESCLRKLPRKIQLPALSPSIPHPYDLLAYDHISDSRHFPALCVACKSSIRTFGYRSREQPNISFHFPCACSLRRPLISKSHPHNLYHFHRDKVKAFEDRYRLICGNCQKYVGQESLYSCIQDGCYRSNFHLGCIDIPSRVKSRHHIHLLTLKDRYEEDSSEEYFCDICEEERDLENDIFICEECLFTAHIECVVHDKVEEGA